jgi:hypothetical protein
MAKARVRHTCFSASVPVGLPAMHYIKHLMDNVGNELCVGDVFEQLLAMVNNAEVSFSVGSANRIIYSALTIHVAIEHIVVRGLQFLSSHLEHFPSMTSLHFEPLLGQLLPVVYRHFAAGACCQLVQHYRGCLH